MHANTKWSIHPQTSLPAEMKSVTLLFLAALLLAACSGASTPDAIVEAAAKAAFEVWAADNDVPYRDLQIAMDSNDGYFAKARLTAWFRPSADTEWEEREAAIDCKRVGEAWRCTEDFTFTGVIEERQRRAEAIGMAYVLVPAGEFLMGTSDVQLSAITRLCKEADSGCIMKSFEDAMQKHFRQEMPQHAVILDEFWIGQLEVTNAQYAACVATGVCSEPQEKATIGRDNYYTDADYADYPVIKIDKSQAQTFCGWVGGRLPTEAEWEKAARGTDGRIYPWGNSIPDETLANFALRYGGTTPVGAFPDGKSPYGALDMAGNVSEWVSDWYQSDYYSVSPAQNPTGPESGVTGLLRGGSWNLYDDVFTIRSAFRHDRPPNDQDDYVGFRCARSQ